jgi:hypothetical protein
MFLSTCFLPILLDHNICNHHYQPSASTIKLFVCSLTYMATQLNNDDNKMIS